MSRSAAAAGIAIKLGTYSFQATGLTAYIKNGGVLEKGRGDLTCDAHRTH